jgi:broad specificity phosphatase PhoE
VTSEDRAARPQAVVPEGLDATLVLVRHGETEYIVEGRFQGHAETPLTALGREQVRLAGERLANPAAWPGLPVPATPPAAIVHSPLVRTTQSAEAIAWPFHEAGGAPNAGGGPSPGGGPNLRPADGLKEIGQGQWEGLLHDEINRRFGAELSGWRPDPISTWAPGGESLLEVDARVRALIGPLLEGLGAGRPASAVDRPQVSGYRGWGVAADAPWLILVGHDGVFKVLLLALLDLPLERFWAVSFPLAGITVIELRGGRAILRAHGLVEHLAPLAAGEATAEAESTERERSGAL